MGARRKKVRLHMSRMQGVVACVGGSFGSGGASALAELFTHAANRTDFLYSDKGVQNHAGETVRTGK